MIRVHKHTSVTSQTLAWRSCKTIKCLKLKNHVFKTNSFFSLAQSKHSFNGYIF